jgi:hypothetical protein
VGDEVLLLQRWLKRARESQFAHYAAAERNSAHHLWIGVPAATLSAIVGTTIFTALDSSQGLDWRLRLLVGLISIVTAILTGCQTFLRFSDKADTHRSAATKYSELRRLIEQSLSFPSTINNETVTVIRTSYDSITEAAPNVSSSVMNKAQKLADHDYFVPGPKPAS